MPIEKSAGAIIFFQAGKKIEYLLLYYPSSVKIKNGYWDFPKGHIEKKEKELEAAKREVAEETGLKDIELIEGFKKRIKYFFKFNKKNVLKFVTFYLAKTKTKKVKVSFEHLAYQ